jgi:rhodanese-related sulfurtransferase
MQSLVDRPALVDRTERITAGSLAERLAAPDPPLLLDVRAPGDWGEHRIAPSVNVPLGRLAERMATLPREQAIVVHCASGYRSAIAASLQPREGYPDVADLVGGLPPWRATAGGEAPGPR